MQKKSSDDGRPRIPPTHHGIQVNFCKNPHCPSDGVPAAQTTGAPHDRRDGASKSGSQRDRCNACKRNVQLTAVGSADHVTGYVFGMHLNFDPDADAQSVERQPHDLQE